jgi:hypothetical protein
MEFIGDRGEARDVLANLEERTSLRRHCDRWRIFMEASCATVLGHFPVEARAWFDVAVGYREGRHTAEEVTAAVAAAWAHERALREHARWREWNATRAAICLLFTDGDRERSDDDWFDTLDYFMTWCNALEDRDHEHASRLRELFADVLEPRGGRPTSGCS